MALKKYVDGEVLYAADLNALTVESLTPAGLNLIRQLIDRDIDFSANEIDWWGDAYIDVNGRENSVDSAATTAVLNDNTYLAALDGAQTDATDTTGSVSNEANAFDKNDSTYASFDEDPESSVGKTFDAKTVEKVFVKAYASAGSGDQSRLLLQTYDGASWSTKSTLINVSDSDDDSYTGTITIDASIQGIKLQGLSSGNASDYKVYTLSYYSGSDETVVVQDIPAGTFNSTISEAIGVPLIEGWDGSDSDVTFKLTNAGGDDSGYLNSATPEVSTFTAFTGEPDTLTIKLTPKTSTPTSGYPSIRGFVMRAT